MMISETLQRARDYEKTNFPLVAEQLPKFHVTGGVGWINDPNGFAPFQGEYHLFYQYHPYETKWGPMHWGHVKTRDFIHWERLPAAMAPDEAYDKDGCFSGGAVEMPDGRHLLMYTGVRTVIGENGENQTFQTQCIAIGDGVNYEKYAGNPVIGTDVIPEGGNTTDFRDPQIWREDGRYYVAVGNRLNAGSSTVLLFQSEDAVHWEFVSKLATCQHPRSNMWECPNFFQLGEEHVLLVSPQDMMAVLPEFHPGNSNLCVMGTYDRESHQLCQERMQSIDYGLDFYAPQTLEALDGRRIMIGWMQNWETSGHVPSGQRFTGQMTIPRELTIRNGRLCQNPVRELENCRCRKVSHQNAMITGETVLEGVRGRFLDLTVTVRPEEGGSLFNWFQIDVARDEDHQTSIRFIPDDNVIRIDRTQSGLPWDIVNVREFPVREDHGRLKLRLILDRYSLEIFVNDGEQAATSIFYTPLEAKDIVFTCKGTARVDMEQYDLEVD
ncbi:glycoside hydrolase family 32 protein [Candidatus Avoscillospira sp. LCP25S3_F1]|uniref:glycoside hydrolase family 32 protein n=1 Tax=Candidatus Avoscillospira sp. LCP25S3_F1 TaxID=3438825 RepID=UPI003F9184DD